FDEKPAFVAATFFVAEIKDVDTAKACLARPTGWPIRSVRDAKVDGHVSKVFSISEGWTSGGMSADIYRAFHHCKCFELGVQEASESTGGLDPGTFKEFTKKDRHEVQFRLRQALNSFRFLK